MRRRRQKNNLLPKMIGIAVIINAILLPILARLGVFKAKKGNAVLNVKLVELPPEKKKTIHKPAPPKKQAKAKTPPRRIATHAAPARLSRPNPNAPKVVTSSAPGGSGPSVDSGTGATGQVPLPPPTPGNGQGGNGQQQAAAPPPPTPAPTPPPPAPAPTPPAAPASPPHVPVVVQAQPVDEPKPQIPDDLQASLTSDATESCLILFSIHADGTATPKLVSGTGNSSLDDLAMQCARKWTFKPATRDGEPVDSFLRLRMDFDVSG